MSEGAINAAAGSARPARARAARLVALLALASLAPAVLLASRESWPVGRALVLARGSGWAACAMLLLALAVAPFERVASWVRPRRVDDRWAPPAPVLRRALGIGAACLGCVHALSAFYGPLLRRVPALWESAQIIAGVTALSVLLVLLLTSFERAIRRTGLRYWKELHRLSYAAALLVAQHVLLGPFASRRVALALLGVVTLLLALRALPRRTSS